MAETINVQYSSSLSNIKKHLSIIGKRLYANDGSNLFSNITTSTNEDVIFKQYIETAAQTIAAICGQFVTSCTPSEGGIQLSVEHERWSVISASFTQAVTSYCILSSVGEYLAMTHPDVAKKYYDDAQRSANAIITLLFYKESPSMSSTDPLQISTTVESSVDGTLKQTVSCNWDTSYDGIGELPHLYGQMVFKFDTYLSGTYEVWYSGDDTTFYYTIGIPDGEGGYNYSLEENTTTLDNLGSLLVQNNDEYVIMVWPDRKYAGNNVFKVYKQ